MLSKPKFFNINSIKITANPWFITKKKKLSTNNTDLPECIHSIHSFIACYIISFLYSCKEKGTLSLHTISP